MKLSLKVKTAMILFLFAVMLTAVASVIGYNVYRNTMNNYYIEMTENLAKTEAVTIDNQKVKKVTESVMAVYRGICAKNSGTPDFESMSNAEIQSYYAEFNKVTESDDYKYILNELETIAEANNVASIYICYMDAATNKAVYIIDGSLNNERCAAGTCDDIESGNMKLMNSGIYDFPAYITNYEEYGWLCSASSAIKDASDYVIANAYIDISMDEVVQNRIDFLKYLCIVLILTALVMTMITIFAVNKTVVSPINKLAAAAKAFASDKEHQSEESEITHLNIQTGDEIENLSYSIKQMEKDINSYIKELTNVTAEKERIGAELSIATHIQASMLPCIFPAFPDRKEFDIYATMDPAKEVGGDFYDFFLIDDNRLAIVMADVSGKGVPAALFMVIAKTLIKNHAQAGKSPAEVFTTVNTQLCENNEEGLFVTAWMGIYEMDTRKFTFVNAGHNPPLLKSADGGFEFLKTRPGFVLAGMESIRYRQHEITLNSGDYLYLYTDGVTEATNAENELYGDDRLKDTLNRLSDCSVSELLPKVRENIDAFVKDAPQFDDITMLALKIN